MLVRGFSGDSISSVASTIIQNHYDFTVLSYFNHDFRGQRELLKRLWPAVHRTLPKPWTVPLTMTATATMPFVRLTDREEQLFRYQNMKASLQIPIGVPA
jgi:hypothetical protein